MAGPRLATIKRLFAVAGNRCAFPECSNPLVDPDDGKVTGRICHIRAQSPEGPRYDPDQTDEERHTFENLILLCPSHHDVADADPEKYSTAWLLGIKAWHEGRYAGGAEASDDVARQLLFTIYDPGAVDAYLEVMATQYSRMETRPYCQLSELRGASARLSLLDEGDQPGVYVPLRFTFAANPAVLDTIQQQALPGTLGLQAALESDDRLRRTTLINTNAVLSQVLITPGHVVFVGAAGSGKTTILRLVAAALAGRDAALAGDELALDLETELFPLPVFVALRDFEHACQVEPDAYRRDVDGLLRFLDDHFERWHPDSRIPAGFVGDAVRSGRAWLLLDALDEVANFDHRIAVRQIIERLADTFPGNRLLVTARVAAYTAATAGANTRLDERFHLATVRDLTREQWAPLVERLYAGLEANPGAAAGRTRLLLERVDATPSLQEMVKTPLMVWTATLIHFAQRDLPEQRAELYNAYVDVLLGERLHEEESAEAAQRLRGERWSPEDRRLYLTYAAYQAHRQAQEERTGRGREAASPEGDGLVVVDERDLVRRILAPFMMDDRGLDARQTRREAADFVALMAERSGLLLAHKEGYSFGDHLTVQEFLAASYLVDDLRDQPGWLDFLGEHAGQSWWQEVLLLAAGHLLRQSRQARRFLLDELGDLPGEGDASACGLSWAGRALLEIPPRRVGWHATNAMYGRFVDEGGYADEHWWVEAQAAGVWRPDGTVKDVFGEERDLPAYWDHTRLNGPNQPVIGNHLVRSRGLLPLADGSVGRRSCVPPANGG